MIYEPMVILHVRVPSTLKQKLQKMARHRQMKHSDLVRQALAELVAEAEPAGEEETNGRYTQK